MIEVHLHGITFHSSFLSQTLLDACKDFVTQEVISLQRGSGTSYSTFALYFRVTNPVKIKALLSHSYCNHHHQSDAGMKQALI